MENDSNTPDYVLSAYLRRCLDNWNNTTRERDAWYTLRSKPGAPGIADSLAMAKEYAKLPTRMPLQDVMGQDDASRRAAEETPGKFATHHHGQHIRHSHSAHDYMAHQRPIENESDVLWTDGPLAPTVSELKVPKDLPYGLRSTDQIHLYADGLQPESD
jgi:hypothetical protein